MSACEALPDVPTTAEVIPIRHTNEGTSVLFLWAPFFLKLPLGRFVDDQQPEPGPEVNEPQAEWCQCLSNLLPQVLTLPWAQVLEILI